MQGTIAQVIALTVYGSAFLNATSELSQGFYPANSTFGFCEYVRFVDLQRNGDKWEEIPYAPDPVAWFERLRHDGAVTLRIISGPSGKNRFADRMLVGFVGGGGRWLIEATGSVSSDYWEGRWQVGEKGRTDRKIWRVTYGRIARDQPSSEKKTEDLEYLKQKLAQNLSRIAEFARAKHLDSFAKAFESGISRLMSQSPYSDLHHADIAPMHVLPLSAHQLLGAAQNAWVFGGMGSWNDLGFAGEDQARYEELSEQLYQHLNKSIVAAANSIIPFGSNTN